MGIPTEATAHSDAAEGQGGACDHAGGTGAGDPAEGQGGACDPAEGQDGVHGAGGAAAG